MAKGFNGKGLSLTVDGTQFSADGTSVLLDSEDADDATTTFGDLDEGTPQQHFLQISFLQNPASNSFHTMLEENAGTEDVAVVFTPFGPGTGKPKYTGTVTIPRRPAVGGDAGATWASEMRLNLDEAPTKTLLT